MWLISRAVRMALRAPKRFITGRLNGPIIRRTNRAGRRIGGVNGDLAD